ncbi:MAG: hypothetical protein KIS61_18680, partial [Candidatus Eremiobacteraeota bacterium]|nr:hypothetical protein [Candidatus Eremiobacteraeota bacterium]
MVKPQTVVRRVLEDYVPLKPSRRPDLREFHCLEQAEKTLAEQEAAPTGGEGYLATIYADLVKPAVHFTSHILADDYKALPPVHKPAATSASSTPVRTAARPATPVDRGTPAQADESVPASRTSTPATANETRS